MLWAAGEVTEALESHFFGVARAACHKQIIGRDAKLPSHILRDEHILVGHNAFNGIHHMLLADVLGDVSHVILEVRRGHGKQQSVGEAASFVDVAGEIDARGVEAHIAQIHRIVAGGFETLYAVGASHIPYYTLVVVEHQFGKGCSPAASTHHGYSARKIICHRYKVLFFYASLRFPF